MAKKKPSVVVPPVLESTPVKFYPSGKEGEKGVVLDTKPPGISDMENLKEKYKEITGVKDSELAIHLLSIGANAIQPFTSEEDRLNFILQVLHDSKPKDAMESRLILQVHALFLYGMSNLKRSETADMMCHSDHYANKAIKLLRLHNETIEALNRYRRGGEQKVTVTHAVIAGQAVVNHFNGVGVDAKNEGESPCSSKNAEPKPEPMAINHVVSPPCQMADAACMEERV